MNTLAADGGSNTLPPLVPLEFKEAIEWARNRSIILPDVYNGQLQGLARAMAFSVAGLTKLDQVQAVKDSLDAALETGASFGEWKKRVAAGDEPILDLPEHRLDNIFRTNLQGAYNRGRYEQQTEAVAAQPWWMYDAVNDSRTRPAHAAMDGKVARHDDPWWKTHTPPNGYNSLLPEQEIVGAVEIGLKAFYSGPAVEIRLKSGARLRVTAQHPVLTDRGWVDAQYIREGDNLVCYSGVVDGCEKSPGRDKYYPPSRADDAFCAMKSMGMVAIPRCAFNLNGDINFIESDVDVVAADGKLVDALETSVSKMLDKFGLLRSGQKTDFLSCFGSVDAHCFAPNGVDPSFSGSIGCNQAKFIENIGAIFSNHRFASIRFDPLLFQMSGNPFSIDMVGGFKLSQSFSGQIAGDAIIGDACTVFGFGAPHHFGTEQRIAFLFGSLSPSLRDIFIGGFEVNSEAFSALREASPCSIKLDNVISFRRFDYCGHVYDFQCRNGIIIAYGGEKCIHPVLSNCRCRRIALSDRQAPQFQRADAKRMQDPEFAAARHTAQPDPGWDYNIGDAPMAGIERAIEQKVARLDHGLMDKLGTEIDDLRAAWPVRGLARRFPARDLGSLHTLLREYANRLPGDLPHGVKFVAEGGPDDDFYMGTDGKGGFFFREIEYRTFNSRRDLFGGLAKCADKQRPPMTPDEEYALESLWHEIWHNRQTGMDQVVLLPLAHPVRRFAETLNQAVARLTYPRFIERLGGQATHQAWIIDNGYGYDATVRRLWQVVRACGLNPLDVAGELATINREADLLEGSQQVAKLLSQRSGYKVKKIQAALDLFPANDALFLSRLGEIKS